MKNMPSYTFRISGCQEEDRGTTSVRIDTTMMKKLGIESGDIVKVAGTEIAGARCFPLDLENKKPYDANFVFLDESSKKIPLIRLSDAVSRNVRMGNTGLLVEVSKATATEANNIVLATNKGRFQYDEKNLALDKLEGFIVCKDSRINIQQSNLPSCTPFLVHAVNPPGEFQIITKNTKFEFIEISERSLYSIPELNRLINVIPAIKEIKTENCIITFPALEIYDNGIRFYLYVNEKFKQREEFGHATLVPSVKAWDDLGNSYVVLHYQGQGGQSTNMIDFHYSMYGVMVPPLDAKAKELNIVIREILWQRIPNPSRAVATNQIKPKSEFNYMTPVRMTNEVSSGPWKFKIPLR